jgi:hypothetical protein
VVNLVEDDEPERVAQFLGPEIRRVVCGDGYRFYPLFTATELPDCPVELCNQLTTPLLEQVDRRHHNECWDARLHQRRNTDHGLSAAGWEFQHSLVTGVVPRL